MLLQCRDVSKSFTVQDRELQVFRDINLSLLEGEKVMICGKSGEGKSVLLSLICGLDRPTAGEILFRNVPLGSCTADRLAGIRRDDIGIIFQNLNLVGSWTALQNVEAALEGSRHARALRRDRSGAILDLFGLGDRLDHLPAELSMGEQQRVAIARTLVREPKLILGDEPTGELDERTAEEILNVLLLYLERQHTSLLVTSHGHFPPRYVDRMLVLEDGVLSPRAGCLVHSDPVAPAMLN